MTSIASVATLTQLGLQHEGANYTEVIQGFRLRVKGSPGFYGGCRDDMRTYRVWSAPKMEKVIRWKANFENGVARAINC